MGRAEFPLEVIISAVDRVTTPLRGVQNNITKFGAAVSNYATKLSLGISAPIAGLYALAAKQSASEQAALVKLGITAGVAGEQLAGMKEAAEKASFPFASPAALDAMSALAVQQVSISDSLMMLPGITRLAIGTQSDFIDSTQAVADTLQAWQIPASDYARVVDVIASSSYKTESTMREFVTHLDQMGPIANRAGIGLEEAAAMLITFERAATKTASGGVQNPAQAAKVILSGLQANSEKAVEVFERLGITADEWIDPVTFKMKSFAHVLEAFRKHGASAVDIRELFGQKAFSPMLGALDAGNDAFTTLIAQISKSGEAQRMAALYSDTNVMSLEKLNQQWKKFLGAVGESGILEVAKDLLDDLTAILGYFKDLEPSTRKWLTKLGLVAVVLFPVVAMVGQMVIGFGAIAASAAKIAAFLGIGGAAAGGAGGAAAAAAAGGAGVAGGAVAAGGGLSAWMSGAAGIAARAAPWWTIGALLLKDFDPKDSLEGQHRAMMDELLKNRGESAVRGTTPERHIIVDFNNLPPGVTVKSAGPMRDLEMNLKMGTLRSGGH